MGYDEEHRMPPPDWGKVLVNTAQRKAVVGDPALWGNTITTQIDTLTPTPAVITGIVTGNQIALAQASDQYTRSWSLSGTLTIPEGSWYAAAPTEPPGKLQVVSGSPDLAVYLSIVQGVEKAAIEHRICLMYGPTSTNIGLCNNQCTRNNGPYLPVTRTATYAGVEIELETRAFAAIGALIGNTITVRGLFARNGAAAEGIIPDATISVLLTPYAPGAGI